ncbi:jg27986, partial [Pararge aegeria aegeria]
ASLAFGSSPGDRRSFAEWEGLGPGGGGTEGRGRAKINGCGCGLATLLQAM